MVIWSMTLSVDFLRFEGHLCIIAGKTQNADTHQHYLNESKGFEIVVFLCVPSIYTRMHQSRASVAESGPALNQHYGQ